MDILLVEDKDSLRKMLVTALEGEDYEVEAFADGDEALEALEEQRYKLVLTDLKLPGSDGLDILESAVKLHPSPAVIVLTAYGTIEEAVKAIKMGASDFLSKPVDIDHLLIVIERALKKQRIIYENILLKEKFSEKLEFPRIVGESDVIKSISKDIQKAATTDSTILLQGESGTGKELFAKAIHALSDRSDKPFVAINCAAIPENLIENELFGHEKGAYTGADSSKMGKFELADGGTLFFDEISELQHSVQAKVLRVIQERSFERVGGLSTINVDVRLIAATNRDLQQEVEEDRFREDLFYRLNVFPVHIPPLRERKEDIPVLAEHFLEYLSREMNRDSMEFSDGAIEKLKSYSWRGNVRELENAIERAIILCDGDTVGEEHLDLGAVSKEKDITDIIDTEGTLKEAVNKAKSTVEKEKIEEALEKFSDKKEAAEHLDISPRTLQKKIKDYHLE